MEQPSLSVGSYCNLHSKFQLELSLLKLASKFPQLYIIRVQCYLVRFPSNIIQRKAEQMQSFSSQQSSAECYYIVTVQRIWTEMVLCTGRNPLANDKDHDKCDPQLLFPQLTLLFKLIFLQLSVPCLRPEGQA